MTDRRGLIGAFAAFAAGRLPDGLVRHPGRGLVYNVRDYGALGDGSDDGPAIRRALEAAMAGHGVLAFPSGTYAYAKSPNFAADDLEIVGYGRVVLRHTGAGPGFLVDGMKAGGQVFNMRVENLILEGNPEGEDGFLFRAVHHGRFARLRVIGGAPGRAGFRTEFFVANSCESWCVSANDRLAGWLPGTGILLTSRPDRESCATVDSTFVNCICEGCATAGMVLEWARNNLVRGGTLENNRRGVGLVISAAAIGNTFDGVFLEDNRLNVDCHGPYTHLSAIYATGSPCRLSRGADACRVHAGYYTTLAIEPGVSDTTLMGVACARLDDAGDRTRRSGCHDLRRGVPIPDVSFSRPEHGTWALAAVLPPWSSAAGRQGPVGFQRSGDGRVWLRGLVEGGTRKRPSTLFVLPVPCRPAFLHSLPVLNGGSLGVLEIRPGGEVVLVEGKRREVALDGVSFEAPPPAGPPCPWR